MTEDAWIAYRGAVALIGDEGAVSRALMTGAVKSRGLIYRPLPGREELEDIPADLWAQWTFLPTFRGLSDKRRALVWLVPPRKELSPICRGYSDIVLVRADVERLVAPRRSSPQWLPTRPNRSRTSRRRTPGSLSISTPCSPSSRTITQRPEDTASAPIARKLKPQPKST